MTGYVKFSDDHTETILEGQSWIDETGQFKKRYTLVRTESGIYRKTNLIDREDVMFCYGYLIKSGHTYPVCTRNANGIVDIVVVEEE